MSSPAVLARPVIAVTAVAAPVASALAVASFHTHTSDPSRQLDLIKANVAGFTGMILLEHLTWVCIAVACVAVAVRIAGRIAGRGAWLAAIGAFLAILGAAGSLGDFGAALPTLARQSDRGAAVSFVNHLGPVYSVSDARLYRGARGRNVPDHPPPATADRHARRDRPPGARPRGSMTVLSRQAAPHPAGGWASAVRLRAG